MIVEHSYTVHAVSFYTCVLYTASLFLYRVLVRGRIAAMSPRLVWWIQRVIDIGVMAWLANCFILYELTVSLAVDVRYSPAILWTRIILSIFLLSGSIINVAAIYGFYRNTRTILYEQTYGSNRQVLGSSLRT